MSTDEIVACLSNQAEWMMAEEAERQQMTVFESEQQQMMA